jgi:hypothetical protein
MALTKVSGGILDPGINVAGIVTATGFDGPFTGGSSKNITAGIITATGFDLNGNGDISGNLVIGGNLTANGDFTTLNTTLREVEILRVDANSSEPAGIITQTGAGDLIRLYDGASQVITVDDEGNVGIRKDAPGTSLHVRSTATGGGNIAYFDDTGSGNTGRLMILTTGGAATDGVKFQTVNRKYTHFGNATNKLTIDNNNSRVGIGTDNPATQLEIHGDSGGTIRLAKGGANRTTVLSGDTLGKIEFRSYDSSLNHNSYSGTYAEIETVVTNDLGGTPSEEVRLDFKIADSDEPGSGKAITPVPALSILQGGNVGIGSTIPSQLLDVAGTIKTTNITSNSSNLSIENTADRVLIKSANRVDIADDMIRFQNRAQNAALLEAVAGASGYVKLYHNNNVVASVTMDTLTVTGRTSNSGMIEIASNQGANNNDRFRLHKTSAASRLTIQNYSTGSWVENIRITAGGAVELKHADGTTKLETTSAGSKISGNLELSSTYPSLTWTDTNHDSDFRITNNDGTLIVYDITRSSSVLDFLANGDLHVRGDKGIYFGESNDLLIGHDGSSTRIDDNYGYLNIRSDILELKSTTGSELYANFKLNGSAKLYYDGTERFATSGIGITVTGEVAASQDYPDFKPSLDLNFAATKKLDPRIKFARQGVASYYDALGNVKFAADNEPRFDHDPDTGECKGLLIEQASVNLISGSADEGSDTRGVYSTLGNGFAINELVSDVIRPTGTPGLVRRVKSHASSNSGGRWGGYNGSGGSPYAGSFWARSVTGTSQVGIDVNDTGYNATTLTTEWVRVEAVGTTGNNYDFMDITLPNTSDDIYIWGMQLEQNAFVSSYIRNPKNSNTAIRGADTAYIDGESFDEFYNQSEGTMVSSHSLLENVSTTSNCYTYQVAPDSGTSEAPFRLIDRNSAYGNTLVATSINSNASVCFFKASGDPATVANVKMKVAFAIKKDDFAASFNGGATLTDTAGNVSETNDHLAIGYYKPSPQAYLNGHIQRLTYYPKRLSNTQLQNLSS